MFENNVEENSKNFTESIYNGLFPIEITRNDKILTIVEKRSYGKMSINFLIIFIVFGFSFYIGYSLLNNGLVIYGVLILLIGLIIIAIFAKQILNTPFKRVAIFDKAQNIYRIIGVAFFENDEIKGKLNEIKKVNINVTANTHSENNYTTYTYNAYLELDSFLAYEDSNIISMQDEDSLISSQKTSAEKIATTIADFLNLSAPEETGDVSSESISGYSDDLSILQ